MFAATNSTSAFYSQSQAQMRTLRAIAETAQLQAATGEKLSRASDDPVASSQLRALARADRLAEVENTNISRLSEESRSADSALDNVVLMLIRAQELTLQAGSDVTSPEGRAAIANELATLRDTIIASANATSIGGKALFGGNTSGPAYTQDSVGNVSYAGSATVDSLEVIKGTSIERGLTGPAVFNFNHAGNATDVFAFLSDLETNIRVGSDPAQSARDASAGFDAAIAAVSQGQTILGARLGWIETVELLHTTRSTERAQQTADLGGVDIAEAITRMQQAMTALEASQASFARLASLNLFDRI